MHGVDDDSSAAVVAEFFPAGDIEFGIIPLGFRQYACCCLFDTQLQVLERQKRVV